LADKDVPECKANFIKQKKNDYLQVLAAALDLPKESAILKNKKEKNHKNVHVSLKCKRDTFSASLQESKYVRKEQT